MQHREKSASRLGHSCLQFVKGFVRAVITNVFRSFVTFYKFSLLAYTHVFGNPWCTRIDAAVKGKPFSKHHILASGLLSA